MKHIQPRVTHTRLSRLWPHLPRGINALGLAIAFVASLALPTLAATDTSRPAGMSAESPEQLLGACFASATHERIDHAACEYAAAVFADNPAQLARIDSVRAVLLARSGQFEPARDLAGQIAFTHSGDHVVLANAGTVAIYDGRFAEAVEAFDQAVTLAEPGDLGAIYLNRSIALRGLGRYGEAHQDYLAYLATQSRSGFRPERDLLNLPESDNSTGPNAIPVEDLSN